MHPPLTIKDVVAALESLEDIERPIGDNEGVPINAPEVRDRLPEQDREKVDNVEDIVYEYIRKTGDMGAEPNNRAITELNKHGYRASLAPDQDDETILKGRVESEKWILDVSDQISGSSGE